MSEQVLHIGRKSLIAYIRSAIGTSIGLLIFGTVAGVAAFNDHPILALFGVGLWLLVLARGIYNLFYIRTFQWIITDEAVQMKQGILPWAKSDWVHPYEIIFEAYYNFGFFAKMFNYGTCHIRRTEGVTSSQSASHMHDAGKISGLINRKVNELRKAQKPPVLATVRSEVEELADLAKLKSNGDITAADYEAMKNKIIGGEQPSPIVN